ncbi:MAG: LysE family transporter [Alphaproteobacteria bacterium]|nr:LysE family transporter [Alphaproteobacteria bacterium]
MELILFFKGMFCGFVIAAPVGPVGVLCVKRTLQLGLMVGFLSGLGAATADTIFGFVAAFGLHFVAEFMLNNSHWIRLVGGILMIGIGIYELLTPPKEKGRRKPITINGMAGWYGSTFLLTITNPITIISFGAVFVVAEAVVSEGDLGAAWSLIAGVFLGSALWFFSLAGFSRLFHHMIDVKGLRVVSRASGVLVIIFGVVVLLSLTDFARRTFGY